MKVWRMHHSFYRFDLAFSIPPPLFLDLITVGLCRHGDYQLLDFEHQMVNRYQVTFYHTSTFLVISEENTTEKMFQFQNSHDNHKFHNLQRHVFFIVIELLFQWTIILLQCTVLTKSHGTVKHRCMFGATVLVLSFEMSSLWPLCVPMSSVENVC